MTLHRQFAWIVLMAWTAPTLGQQPSKPEPPAARSGTFEVIALKFTNATELASVLKDAFKEPEVRIVADDRSNSLVVSAPAEVLADVRAMVARLDVRPQPSEEPKGRRLSVLPVASMRPENSTSLIQIVELALGRNGRFAIDPARKAVVVHADEAGAKSVSEVLARLEAEVARPAQDVQVRIVCLVQGDPREEAPAPPSDLKEVMPVLAKLGMDRPRLAAQTLVHASANHPFVTQGVSKLTANPSQFDVSGRYLVQGDSASLFVKVSIWRAPNNVLVQQNSIETTITAPPGHFVVLGVTPLENLMAAYVVQVLPREDKPTRR